VIEPMAPSSSPSISDYFDGSRRQILSNFDFRLLAIIKELHRTRSVSQVAERLELTQSAISMSLAKLRKYFNDPLFVRTSRGMEPTPRAIQIIRILGQAENVLLTAFDQSVLFCPQTSERVFRIESTDTAQVTLAPKLMCHLREAAPSVRIDLQRIGPDTAKLLESGELDLAIGFMPPMGAGFCHQRLFNERFVCAARSGHPRIGDTLTLEEFETEQHLSVTTLGTGHGVVERILELKKVHRRVALEVSSFLGIASIMEANDYLIILPEQLAQNLTASGAIKVFALPFEMPSYPVMQHWHERYSQDASSRWLRNVIAHLFLTSEQSPQRLKAISGARAAAQG
jgi:DNA-binding transcriptional LysR family regulator